MKRTRTRLLRGTRVTELTGLHGNTLKRLVEEGFLLRSPNTLNYSGLELVVARLLKELETRATKATAERDRLAVAVLRDALIRGEVRPSTDLVLSLETATLAHTFGERIDATQHLRDHHVFGVGVWLATYKDREPEAFEESMLIAAAAVAA